MQALDTDRPVMAIGDCLLHGKHFTALGTSVVVRPGGGSGSTVPGQPASIVALTSNKIVFKIVTPGGKDRLLQAVAKARGLGSSAADSSVQKRKKGKRKSVAFSAPPAGGGSEELAAAAGGGAPDQGASQQQQPSLGSALEAVDVVR